MCLLNHHRKEVIYLGMGVSVMTSLSPGYPIYVRTALIGCWERGF